MNKLLLAVVSSGPEIVEAVQVETLSPSFDALPAYRSDAEAKEDEARVMAEDPNMVDAYDFSRRLAGIYEVDMTELVGVDLPRPEVTQGDVYEALQKLESLWGSPKFQNFTSFIFREGAKAGQKFAQQGGILKPFKVTRHLDGRNMGIVIAEDIETAAREIGLTITGEGNSNGVRYLTGTAGSNNYNYTLQPTSEVTPSEL